MPNGLPNKKSSSAKIIASCLGIFAVLIVLSTLCLPLLFSTNAGKKFLIRMISNRTGFQIEIEELSVSWFGSQKAKGVHAQKAVEQIDFTAHEIQTDSPLWKLAFMNHVGHLEMTAPHLQISKPFQPTSHIRQKSFQSASFATGPKVQIGMSQIEFPMQGKVVVTEGKVELNSPGLEPITFDQIALSFDILSKEEIALNLNCSTSQQGQIAIKGSATQLKAPFPNLSMVATINQLPVRGIDQLLALPYPELSGLLYSFLGPTINLGCNLSASAGNFDLRFNAVSPQVTAYVATQSLKGILSLKSPAEFNFNITPPFFQKIAKLYPSLHHLALTTPTLFQTTVEQFSCPVPSNARDLLQSSFQAKLSAPPQISLTINDKPLSIKDLIVQANSGNLDQQLSANLHAQLQTQKQTGSIAFESNLKTPFKDSKNGIMSLNIEHFPMDLIGAFATTHHFLSDLLGPFANLKAVLDIQPRTQNLHLNWQSDFLSIPSLDLSMDETWTLASPSSFTLKLNPQFINGLFPTFPLAKAEPLQGTLQSLTIPTQNIKNSRLEAILNAGQLSFNGAYSLNLAKTKTLLSIKTLDQIALQIDGDPFKAMLAGSYNPATSIFTLTKPLFVQSAIDRPTLKSLIPSAPELVKPTTVQLSIDPVAIALTGFDPAKLKIKGQLSSADMVLGTQLKQITLQNTSIPFQWDGIAKTAALQLSSQVQNPTGGSGNMQGQFTLSNFSTGNEVNFSQAMIQGSLELQNLSATLLDAFTGKHLSAITGPNFSSKIKLQSGIDKQNIAIKWVSPNLTMDTGFIMDNACLQLQGTNNQISLILTPEGYKSLDELFTGPTTGLIPFEIKETSHFTCTISKLSIPVTTKQPISALSDRFPSMDFNLAKLQLNASVRNPKLTFLDKSSHDTIQLTNLAFLLNKSEQSPLALSMDSTVTTQGGTSTSAKNGSLSLNCKLEQTLNAQGVFDLSQLTGGLQLKAQQIPSRALDIFARAKGRIDFPFTTLFGNMINATLNIDLNKFSGPVSLNVNTPLTRADLNGTIKNGTLMLKDSVHVQMKITPEVSRLVLREVNPLNLSYVYSEEPITLEIPASGFSFPLYPFNLAKIAIPAATIELGKITCRNEGNVKIALGLLKTKQFDKNKDLTLWFAPIELNVLQGFTNLGRTEILLADTFDICLWGKVDLVQDYIDMVLGLTAQTLSKAFGIKNLPENYVLTIPMRGKADNVQIDTSKATAKVALLLAWQQAGSAVGGVGKGPAGAIVGGLLNKMATLPDSDAKVPPAKHPFPWEVGKSKTSHELNEKKRQFKLNEKPLKQILKLIK